MKFRTSQTTDLHKTLIYMQNGIQTMNFRILSADDIQRHAVIKVTNSILYDGLTNNPTKNGLLDRRLGSFFVYFICLYFECNNHC